MSGGMDSSVLAWLLAAANHRFDCDWDILACHVDQGFDRGNAEAVRVFCRKLAIPCIVVQAGAVPGRKNRCFECSRRRRQRLLEIAERTDRFTIALAHRQEDVAETLLLNILFNGEIAACAPRQGLVHGRYAIIRPLYYFPRKTVAALGRMLGLSSAPACPHEKGSRRELVRGLLARVRAEYPDVYRSVFESLRRVKTMYLPAEDRDH